MIFATTVAASLALHHFLSLKLHLFFSLSAKLFLIRWQRWIELTVKNSGNSVWRASSRF